MTIELKIILAAVIIICGLIGIVFTVVGIVCSIADRCKQLRCTEKTNGVILEIEQETTYDGGTMTTTLWYPVYQYYIDDIYFEKTSDVGFSKKIFHKGQAVEIYYNPNDYNELYVEAAKTKKTYALYVLIGLLCITVAVVIGLLQLKLLGFCEQF